jgi:drug/metabolite transporter (DMT)-like permease
MFDEMLGWNVMAGMAITLIGIYLVVAPAQSTGKLPAAPDN